MLSVPVEIRQVNGEFSRHAIDVREHVQLMFTLPLQDCVRN